MLPIIKAPMTVLPTSALILACFSIKKRELLHTTTIISPSFTLLELTTLELADALSASTSSPFFTLEERNTSVPFSLTTL